ncbi:hypothetical protein INT47_012825, partial [Mucor saturninus]
MTNPTGNALENLAGSFADLNTVPGSAGSVVNTFEGTSGTPTGDSVTPGNAPGTTTGSAGEASGTGNQVPVNNESEDVDMDRYASDSGATHLVLDKSLQGIMNTEKIAIPSGKTPSRGSESAIEIMKGRRKDLSDRIATLLAVEGNPDATELEVEHCTTLIDTLNRRIAILEEVTNESSTVEKGTQDSKWATMKDSFRINNSDLPKFQLVSTPGNFYPSSPRYENVKIYLREFEKVVKASTDQIDVVWKRLIELNLPHIYDEWVESELSKCITWAEAKKLFEKKFGNVRGREEAIRRVYNSFMTEHESIEEYTTHFLRDIHEAGRKKTDPGMAEKYRTSLHSSVQTNLLTVMEAREKALDTFTIDEIAEIARSVFRHNYLGSHDIPVRSTGESLKGKRKAPLVDSGFFCSKHGGPKATHNERDCHSVKKANHGTNNVFLGQKNAPFKATGNRETRLARPC